MHTQIHTPAGPVPAATVPPGESTSGGGRRARPARGGRRARARWALECALAVLAAALLGSGYVTATLGTVLGALALGGAVVAVVSRAVAARTGALESGLLRAPWRHKPPGHVLQLLNRLVFWPLVGVAAGMSVSTATAPAGAAVSGAVLGWAAVGVLVVLALVPRRRILLVPNVVMLVTSLFLGAQFVRLGTPVVDAVTLDSPVRGTWYVGSGGRSVLLNHHYPVPQQRHAVDLAMVRGDGPPTDPRAYPAFGRTVYAPADGTVVAVRSDLPDLPVGTADPAHPLGNLVVLRLDPDRFVLMAHLQQGSVAVAPGRNVRTGQPLGRVGNSGNTGEPHLHLQVQDRPALVAPDGRGWTAGLRTFPVRLRDTARVRDGHRTVPAADLRRDDVLQAPEPARW